MDIHVDMDGVLAKFMFGTPFERIFVQRYFLDLPPQLNIVEAIRELCKEHTVRILSAYLLESNYALAEKKRWLRTWIPEIPEENWIFLPCGESKGIYLRSPGDILIDDRRVHGKEWQDAGGRFIKVSVDRNDAGNESKDFRYVISPDMKKTEILDIVNRRIYDAQ